VNFQGNLGAVHNPLQKSFGPMNTLILAKPCRIGWVEPAEYGHRGIKKREKEIA